MVTKIQGKNYSSGNVAKDYTDGFFWLRRGQSTPDLLRRRPDGTSNLHFGELTESSNRNKAESIATLSDDSRSRATSTDTLRSNIALLDRCISTGELKRRGEGDARPMHENTSNHSIYSTWL